MYCQALADERNAPDYLVADSGAVLAPRWRGAAGARSLRAYDWLSPFTRCVVVATSSTREVSGSTDLAEAIEHANLEWTRISYIAWGDATSRDIYETELFS